MDTLHELFEDSVKDIYSAEKLFLKVMPKMARAAKTPSVKEAIETHITQSEEQLQRLEQIADDGGFKLGNKICKAAMGLVEETEEHLKAAKPGPVLDAAILACAQKNEHYEIGTYTTLIEWAHGFGMKDAVELFKQTLAEEEATGKLLSGIAKKEVTQEALHAGDA